MGRPHKLKRAVLKEELVALTGHHVAALLLSQLLYWTERMDDIDRYLAEEQARQHDVTLTPTHGWIYKAAGDLVDELMLEVSEVTVRRHLAALLAQGFVEERRNPEYRWDRTLQYRVNVVAVQHGLAALGYALDDYPLVHLEPHGTDPTASANTTTEDATTDAASHQHATADDPPPPSATMKDRSFKLKDASFKMKDRSFNLKDRSFNLKHGSFKTKDRSSTMKDRGFTVKDRSVGFEGAIPETPPEITPETPSEIPSETTTTCAPAHRQPLVPAHPDHGVVVALEALGLSRRQATRAAHHHHLTLSEVERWACWRDHVTHVSNPVALLAATIAEQRLPPGDLEPSTHALSPQLPITAPASEVERTTPHGGLWAAVCATLHQRLDDSAFDTWFADAHLLVVNDDRVVVGTPLVFARDQLATAYLTPLTEALRDQLGCAVTVEVVIDGGGP